MRGESESVADVNAESVSVAERFDLSSWRRIKKAAVIPFNATMETE